MVVRLGQRKKKEGVFGSINAWAHRSEKKTKFKRRNSCVLLGMLLQDTEVGMSQLFGFVGTDQTSRRYDRHRRFHWLEGKRRLGGLILP